MIKAHFDSFITPSAVYSDLVQKLNQIAWSCLKICLLQQQLRTRVVVSVHTNFDLEWTVYFSMFQCVIKTWECLLNDVLDLVKHTLHWWCAIQRDNRLTYKVSYQWLLIKLVNFLNYLLDSLRFCIKTNTFFMWFVRFKNTIFYLFKLLIPFVIVCFFNERFTLLYW